jgi:DNA replication protein DnaC
MKSTVEMISAACRELKLGQGIVNNMSKIEERDREKFLLRLLEMEIKNRAEKRRERNIKSAGFFTMKSFSDYEYKDVELPANLPVKDIETVEFVRRKENLILYGNSGTGKTHLATAIGIKACMEDMRVGFYRTAGLVNKLLESREKGELDKFFKKLSKLDLIICDEWGYVPLDKVGGQLLFQVISDCYETKSLIITTNLEFSKWVNIFYDQEMTAAMIDRLVHHSHLIIFKGESWRIKNALINKKNSPSA